VTDTPPDTERLTELRDEVAALRLSRRWTREAFDRIRPLYRAAVGTEWWRMNALFDQADESWLADLSQSRSGADLEPQAAPPRGVEHAPADAFDDEVANRAAHDLAVARAIARGIPEDRARRLWGYKG
jgi:hypothetical protein